MGARVPEPEPEDPDVGDNDAPSPRHPLEGETCPHCRNGRLLYVEELLPRRDIPP
jgi:hypothetical protein